MAHYQGVLFLLSALKLLQLLVNLFLFARHFLTPLSLRPVPIRRTNPAGKPESRQLKFRKSAANP